MTKKGSNLGSWNGMGSAGREYVPGYLPLRPHGCHRSLRGWQARGPCLTDPELRLKDQERDGVQAEVLYGILGATWRLNDAEAAVELVRIYNEWLAAFCDAHPDYRHAGLACIPTPRRGRRGRDEARDQTRRRARSRDRPLYDIAPPGIPQ